MSNALVFEPGDILIDGDDDRFIAVAGDWHHQLDAGDHVICESGELLRLSELTHPVRVLYKRNV